MEVETVDEKIWEKQLGEDRRDDGNVFMQFTEWGMYASRIGTDRQARSKRRRTTHRHLDNNESDRTTYVTTGLY